ncbi:MAG TPA: hypothetical protein VHJ78_13295 [Actinomycetota bacterium]|nr:hypothetical protein [Actinomycetota bacterium]
MTLLMVGSFPLMMTVVLMLAVWVERLLDNANEKLVRIEENFDPRSESTSPQAGVAIPASRAAYVSEPEL